jgi:carbamoyl-phosphate synthase large subunit
MRRVLVSGASGIVGYGVLRSLRSSGLDLFLVGSSIYNDSVAPAFCDVFEQAPPTNEEGYLEWLLATTRRHRIDLLVPAIEVDTYKWAGHVPDILAAGAIPLLNTSALLDLCKDKWRFYQQLKKLGSRCAIDSSLEQDFEVLASSFGLPFLLKPRRGFGSKGIVRVTGMETYREHVQDVGRKLMAQPIVGSDAEEFTTSAFCDGEGAYFTSMTLRRKLSRDGFTEKAEVVDTADFAATIAELCQAFRPLGPTNFQFRVCSDGPKLLEINPRISSSTSIRAAFGYNESAMAVEYFLHHRMPVQPQIKKGRAVRYTDEFIFYEDSLYL